MRQVFHHHIWKKAFCASRGMSGTLSENALCSRYSMWKHQLRAVVRKSWVLVTVGSESCWWMQEMKETIKLKIEAFYIWLARRSTKAADRYCLARRTASRAVTEAKMGAEGVWRGHGEGF